MLGDIKYPVNFKGLATIVSSIWVKEEEKYVEGKNMEDTIQDFADALGRFGQPPRRGSGETYYRKIVDRKIGFNGTPSSNLTNFLVHFGGMWSSIRKDSREKKIEDREGVFNELDVYNKGYWRSSDKDKVKFEERKDENKGIAKAFKDTNKGIRVVEERIDAVSLVMSSILTDLRKDIKEAKDGLKEYEDKWVNSQPAWKRMEAELGEVKDSVEEMKKTMKEYETDEERWVRKDMSSKIWGEVKYLNRIKLMAQVKELSDRSKEISEREKKEQDERDKKDDRDREFWDAYFAADFKRMGYIYVPAWCYYRPQGIIREEYNHYQRGEPIGKGRLIASVSALSTYLIISVWTIVKLPKYLWKKWFDLNAAIEERLREIIREDLGNKSNNSEIISYLRSKWIKGGCMIALIEMVRRVYSYIRMKVNEKGNKDDKDKGSFDNVSLIA